MLSVDRADNIWRIFQTAFHVVLGLIVDGVVGVVFVNMNKI